MANLEQYGRWMRTFPYRTPVDRVVFVAPGGEQATRATFLHQPADLIYDDHGYEHLSPKGRPVYAVRFTPEERGWYRYQAMSGQTSVEEGGVQVEPSSRPGYVLMDPKRPRYFINSDGTSFCPIGLCMAGPPRYRLPKGSDHFETAEEWAALGAAEYGRWFRLLSENGGNFARIWLSHPYFSTETDVAGDLDLAAFARLDAVIEHARTYNIRLKLCFDHFRTFTPGSSFYKDLHHPDDGRTPVSLDEWLREPTWRELWLKKAQAYTARYGGDPVVAIWELWNEMDCVDGGWDLVLAWTKDMLQEIKGLAPRQLVTSSMGSFDDEMKLAAHQSFKLPEMDVQQVHRYLDQGAPWEVCRGDPVALSIDAIRHTLDVDRPVLLAETGAVNDRHTGPFRYYRSDNRGIIFHDTTFPAFFAGAAGTGQIWHWDAYVDQKDLWRFYRPFSELLKGLKLQLDEFVPADLSNDQAWFLALKGRGHVLGWVRNKADSWQSALRDGLEPPVLEGQVFDLEAIRTHQGEVQLVWPWGEVDGEVPPGEASLVDGRLALPPFRYGVFVRINPQRRSAK